MKRYMVYSGCEEEQDGDLSNFIGDFETIDEVLDVFELPKFKSTDWVQVFDNEKQRLYMDTYVSDVRHLFEQKFP